MVISQQRLDSRFPSLEDKVSSMADKLDAIFSLLSNTNAKKGEKIVATKCTSDSIQAKDKTDDDGDKDPVANVLVDLTVQQHELMLLELSIRLMLIFLRLVMLQSLV